MCRLARGGRKGTIWALVAVLVLVDCGESLAVNQCGTMSNCKVSCYCWLTFIHYIFNDDGLYQCIPDFSYTWSLGVLLHTKPLLEHCSIGNTALLEVFSNIYLFSSISCDSLLADLIQQLHPYSIFVCLDRKWKF